ncbi:MAG: rhodanese-like domain-containing protein [Neisseria sp.]|nr:rhodanese-like domain-containing protein [Neisseria sp.]
MKKLLPLILLPAVLAAPLAAQAADDHRPAAAAAGPAAKAKGVWIDVRSPEEYREGHLQGAVNIPFDQIAEKIAAASPDKNAPVNLYCKSGRRAALAKQTLEKMGYTNVTNHGGYQDLTAKGFK